MRGLQRLGLVLGGVLLAVGLGELGLRLLLPDLPSLAALHEGEWGDREDVRRWTDPPTDPATCGEAQTHRPQRLRTTVHGQGEPRTLWVVGDSLVHSWGVDWPASWPAVAADAVAVQHGRRLSLSRLGASGFGYCRNAAALNHLLDLQTPDAVVFQLFADDLERRSVVLVGDAVAAVPRHPLTRHSYLANRLWLSWTTRLGSAQPERDADAVGLARFMRVMSALGARLDDRDIPWLVVLVPPAGVERCGEGAEAWSDCDWLRGDLDRMAEELRSTAIPTLDLRTLWREEAPGTLPDEEQAWTERGRLPVHPAAAGHAAIGQRVAETLASALSEAWPDSPAKEPG